MSHSRRLREILEKSKQQIRQGDWLNHEDIWKQVEADNVERREPEGSQPKARASKPRNS